MEYIADNPKTEKLYVEPHMLEFSISFANDIVKKPNKPSLVAMYSYWFSRSMQIPVICTDVIAIYYSSLNQQLLYLHFPRSEWEEVLFDVVCIHECVFGLCKLAPSVDVVPPCIPSRARVHPNSLAKETITACVNKDMHPYASLQRCCSSQ